MMITIQVFLLSVVGIEELLDEPHAASIIPLNPAIEYKKAGIAGFFKIQRFSLYLFL
jgi:hypothetical protein